MGMEGRVGGSLVEGNDIKKVGYLERKGQVRRRFRVDVYRDFSR